MPESVDELSKAFEEEVDPREWRPARTGSLPAGKTKLVSLRLPEDLYQAILRYSEEVGSSFSEVLREGAQRLIEGDDETTLSVGLLNAVAGQHLTQLRRYITRTVRQTLDEEASAPFQQSTGVVFGEVKLMNWGRHLRTKEPMWTTFTCDVHGSNRKVVFQYKSPSNSIFYDLANNYGEAVVHD